MTRVLFAPRSHVFRQCLNPLLCIWHPETAHQSGILFFRKFYVRELPEGDYRGILFCLCFCSVLLCSGLSCFMQRF